MLNNFVLIILKERKKIWEKVRELYEKYEKTKIEEREKTETQEEKEERKRREVSAQMMLEMDLKHEQASLLYDEDDELPL